MSRVVFATLGLALLASSTHADQVVRATWYGNELRGTSHCVWWSVQSGWADRSPSLLAAWHLPRGGQSKKRQVGCGAGKGSRTFHRRPSARPIVGRGARYRYALNRRRDDATLL